MAQATGYEVVALELAKLVTEGNGGVKLEEGQTPLGYWLALYRECLFAVAKIEPGSGGPPKEYPSVPGRG